MVHNSDSRLRASSVWRPYTRYLWLALMFVVMVRAPSVCIDSWRSRRLIGSGRYYGPFMCPLDAAWSFQSVLPQS